MNNSGLIIIRRPNIIQVQSAFPIFPNFQNFSIVVPVDGQKVFTLPSYPILTGLISVNIDGVTQDPLSGDFTVNGNILTMNADLIAGQKIAGFYQAMAANVSPNVLSYRNFFITAIQDQQIFDIGFVPKQLIYIAINGTIQSAQDGDYTVSGQNVTMSQVLDAGDKFFGLAIQ